MNFVAPEFWESLLFFNNPHLQQPTFHHHPRGVKAKISHRDDGLFYVLSREAMEPERPLGSRWSSFGTAGFGSKMLRVELVD